MKARLIVFGLSLFAANAARCAALLIDSDKLLRSAYCIGSYQYSISTLEGIIKSETDHKLKELLLESVVDIQNKQRRAKSYLALYLQDMPINLKITIGPLIDLGSADAASCSKQRSNNCKYNDVACGNRFDICRKLSACDELGLPF